MAKHKERLQAFQSAHNKRWYWRKIAGNGRIPAVGGEQFPTMFHAKRAALKQFPGLPVEELGLRRFPVPIVPRAPKENAASTEARATNMAGQPVETGTEE